MCRAERELILTFAKEYRGYTKHPSRFLREMGPSLMSRPRRTTTRSGLASTSPQPRASGLDDWQS